ncbi:FMN reductase [Cryobacterium mesophilum]|uniref:NADPH-dependent FMN reductase n=1 Tax=Terrimesophilobacter mesophilus TaxID=433647 RepID=A0A4R8V7E8_9MICO|nr:FMN reductase [Terrimesophilobacter mesophilus]MBB5632188.1 FMN reductase [Terrimesophilobacter mesophilus]TFB79051.1 NADPH-dependent FMN reductase [Terrimesophilobacter mesophilus]
MTKRRIAVVSAGLAKPSSTRMLADRISTATVARLAELGVEVTVDTIELRDTAVDVTNNLLTGFPSPKLEETIETVATADGLIAVTPVFTTSYNGLFKSFFDVLDPQSLNGAPVLIGATAGTPRHSLVLDYALRPLFTYLHAVVVPTGVFAASADWGDAGDRVATLQSRVERAAAEFASLVAVSDRSSQVRDPFELDSGFSPTGSYMID